MISRDRKTAKGSCSTSSGWTTKKECGSPVNGSCSTSSEWTTKKHGESSEHLKKALVPHQMSGLQRNMGAQ